MARNSFKYDEQWGLVQAWHNDTKVKPELTLENNYLTTWDIVPVELIENLKEITLPDGSIAYQGDKSGLSRLVCSDNHAIKIGQGYNPLTFSPINNAKFIELVRQSISGTSHKIVSVGSVRNRGRVFLSIELMGMETFKAAGRNFSAYLNFGNGHDKSSVLWVNTSNTAVVCDNTYSINLVSVENKASAENEDDISIRQRHTKNADIKLPEIAKLVDKAIGVQGEFAIELDKLAEIEIVKTDAKALFAGFIGRNSVAEKLSTRATNTVDKLLELHVNGRGNNGRDLADAFNAVTDFYSHFSSGGKNINRQIVSSEYGSGLVAKQSFWNMVRNPVKRSEMIVRGDALLTATV
jgi:hypothetical protein